MSDAAPNRCVLFDLDGTLADTALDLVGALNELRAEQGLEPLPVASMRAAANGGAAKLVEAGLDENNDAHRQRFLELYGARLCRETRLFPEIASLLNALDARDVPWGVVTNKPTALTGPILDALGITARAGTIVCGDTVAESKPHPAPVRHALAALDATPAASWYLGDAERDVTAARGAGMRVAVALWGYLDDNDDPAAWGADACLASPGALIDTMFAPPANAETG